MSDHLLLPILIIIAGFIIAGIARVIVRWLKKYAETTDTKLDDIVVAAIGTPVQVGIIAISIYVALKYFDILPPDYSWILSNDVLNSIYILLGTWIVSSILHDFIKIYGHEIAAKTEGDLDDRLMDLLELATRYVVWFAGIMLVFVNLDINITPFLAGAGIAGAALALAAQDFLSNFFGGIVITVDKPFKIGDRIEIGTYYGDVISIGTRSTRIKTLDGKIVIIPNSNITSNSVVNYSDPDPKMRYTLPVSVAYGTDIHKAKKVIMDAVEDARKHTDYFATDAPAPKVFFKEFGDSSLNFVVYVWAKAYNLPDEVKDSINTRIVDRFEAEGIEIPFNQLEVRLRK